MAFTSILQPIVPCKAPLDCLRAGILQPIVPCKAPLYPPRPPSPPAFQTRPSRGLCPREHLRLQPPPHPQRHVQAALCRAVPCCGGSGELPRRAGGACRGVRKRWSAGEERWGARGWGAAAFYGCLRPYEEPLSLDLTRETDKETPEESMARGLQGADTGWQERSSCWATEQGSAPGSLRSAARLGPAMRAADN
jgi:hypothetical protein